MINFKNLTKVVVNIIKVKLGYRIPLKVTQYITYKCNLACKFCGRRNINTPEMSTEQIKNCLREFKEIGTMFWSFNGGEPLLRQDIGELIDYSKKLDLKCSITTNGILIPLKINQIKNLDLVTISIDGPEQIHDQIRGKGNFSKTIKSLEILRKNNIKIYISSVLNKTNLDYLDDIWKISEEHDAYLEFSPITIHKEGKNEETVNYFPEKEKFQRAINWLISEKKRGRKIANSFNYLNQLKRYPSFPMIDCWASHLFCSVTPDGFVVPCSEMLGEYKNFQSGLKSNFKKAFYDLPDLKKCHQCYFSCYGEYNCGLNSLTKTGLRVIKNIWGGGWFWQ